MIIRQKTPATHIVHTIDIHSHTCTSMTGNWMNEWLNEMACNGVSEREKVKERESKNIQRVSVQLEIYCFDSCSTQSLGDTQSCVTNW